MNNGRNFQNPSGPSQIPSEPLPSTHSRYICLRGLVKLKKLKEPGYVLRHWIGYRKKLFEPR